MKRKSKLLIAFVAVCLLVTVLAVSMVACNKGNDANSPETPEKPGGIGGGGGGENTPCEHSYDEVDFREPLCEEDGNIHYYKCNLCGKYFDDDYEEIEESETILAATGHDTHKVDRVDATCVDDGNVDYWHCDKCNKNFPDQAGKQLEIEDVTLGKTGHTTHKVDRVDPTCVADGNIEYWQCDNCPMKFYDQQGEQLVTGNVTLSKTGHSTHKVDRVDPTCVADGNIEYWQCDNCRLKFYDQQGEQPVTMDVTLSKTGHSTRKVDRVDATCVEDGNVDYWHCDKCNKNFPDQAGEQPEIENVTLGKTGHAMQKVDKVDATCVRDGNIEYWQCDNCRLKFYDQQGEQPVTGNVTTQRLGHSYTGEYGYNDYEHWHKCVRCGADPSGSSDKYGHTVKEGEVLCECGCAPGYELVDDDPDAKYYKLTAYRGQSENVVIPDEIKDIPVKIIGANVFYNTSIKSVSIGKNVETIERSAFSSCRQLQEVVLPEGVKILGDSAFGNCTSLQSITLPSTLEKLGTYVFSDDAKLDKIVISSLKAWCELLNNSKIYNVLNFNNNLPKLYIGENKVTEVTGLDGLTTIYHNTFYGQDITTVTIPESLQKIENEAFEKCTQINKVIIPSVKAWCDLQYNGAISLTGADFYVGDSLLTEITAKDLEGVTAIGGYKFMNCTSLQSVEIPTGVTVGGFSGCTNLKTLTGDANILSNLVEDVKSVENIVLTSLNGETFYFGNSTLKTVTIGGSITEIRQNAFYNCRQLTTVNIDNGVQTIGYDAFFGCMQLQEITLPASLRKFDTGAFEGCKALTKVDFLGTIKEWLSIEFADNINHTHEASPLGASGKAQLYINGKLPTTVSMEDMKGVTAIPIVAFRGCAQLTEISIPSTVTEIKCAAFDGCTGLTKVNIESIAAWCNIKYTNNGGNNKPLNANYPKDYAYNASINQAELYLNGNKLKSITAADLEGVTNIPTLAFASCTELTSVEIPESVTEIGGAAFADCSMLTSVTVNGDPKCGNYVFIRSTKIQEATVPGSMTTYISKDSLLKITFTTGRVIGFSAFQNAPVLHTVIMKEDVTEVGDSVFFRCKELKTLDLGKVQKIGSSAFAGCSALETLTINEGTTEIGYYAFQSCTGLRTLIIASSVQKIAQYAFQSCEDLSVYYLGDRDGWYAATNRDFTIFDQSTYNLYYYSAESNTDGQHWHWDDEVTKTTPVVWGKEE